MKKLTILVIRSFIGPMVITFLISLFVLLMIFLWKYIDDLAGKGLGAVIIMKLMVYVSITSIPLALPLSLLLSSIMTFGNLAEHFELTAFKAAGVSLQRVMRPLTVLAVLICIGAFLFSNWILPVANLKMNALLYDVRQQKPALFIKEGVFYTGIDGYSIRVGQKDEEGKNLRKLLIYDHTSNRGNTKVITAESGKMAMSEDERFLLLTLFKGSSFEEGENRPGRNTHPLTRTDFEQEVIRFDLSSFKMTRTNEQLFKDNYQMLNLKQLSYSADSIRRTVVSKDSTTYRLVLSSLNIDSGKTAVQNVNFTNDDLLLNFPADKQKMIALNATYSARNLKNIAEEAKEDIDFRTRNLYRHEIEWQRKFTLSFACLIFFFIGAPLGAIIRKGGLGLPIVFSIIFFVLYHIISITSEKFVRETVITASKGMWISSIVLLPIGIFLTYKATRDSALFERDAYVKFFRKYIFRKKTEPAK